MATSITTTYNNLNYFKPHLNVFVPTSLQKTVFVNLLAQHYVIRTRKGIIYTLRGLKCTLKKKSTLNILYQRNVNDIAKNSESSLQNFNS